MTSIRKPVSPSARMLSAVPETTWSMRSVPDANAWMADRRTPATSVTTTPKNAPTSIMPSSAMLTTPERSQMVPPIAARASGVAMRMADANRSGVRKLSHIGVPLPLESELLTALDEPGDDRLGAHEEDDERLHDHDDLVRDVGRELHHSRTGRERSEQDRGEDDGDRVVLGEQRDCDAGEAEPGARGHLVEHPVLDTEDLRRAGQARKGSRDAQSVDGRDGDRDAAVLGGPLVETDGADTVAERRLLQDPPHQDGERDGDDETEMGAHGHPEDAGKELVQRRQPHRL